MYDETHLTTRQAVIDWCKISAVNASLEAQIDSLIERVSAFLTLQIAESGAWFATDFVELRDGNGKQFMAPKHQPVNSITSVKIDGVVVPLSVNYTTPGYTWDEDFIKLIGYRFTPGVNNVEISYNAGIEQSDLQVLALEQAVLEAINLKWRRREHPDQFSAKTGQSFLSEQFVMNDFPPEVWTTVRLLRSRLAAYED